MIPDGAHQGAPSERALGFALVRNMLLGAVVDGRAGEQATFDDFAIGRRLRVSRSTIRAALTSLAAAGIVRRVRHAGTSPLVPLTYYDVGTALPRYAAGSLEGVRFRTDRVARVPVPPSIAPDLGLEPDAPVTLVNRTTLVDGLANEHWTIWCTWDLDTADRALPDRTTWFEILRQRTGARRFTVRQWTTGLVAGEVDAELLDVRVGAPLLVLSRLVLDERGDPVERSFGVCSAERTVVREQFEVTAPS